MRPSALLLAIALCGILVACGAPSATDGLAAPGDAGRLTLRPAVGGWFCGDTVPRRFDPQIEGDGSAVRIC